MEYHANMNHIQITLNFLKNWQCLQSTYENWKLHDVGNGIHRVRNSG